MSHECPRDGCTRIIGDDRLLFCGPDWKLVPLPFQRAVYAAYRRGRGLGSAELLAAQEAAVRAVNGEPEPERLSPGELREQAGGNRDLYRDLLRQHGHLLSPGDEGYDENAPRTLPCGWSPA